MTSQGSAAARFRRALATGNPLLVTAACHELGRVELADALAVCLVYLQADQGRYDRAAVRWHARFCIEHSPGFEEAQLVLAALRGLADTAARSASAEALAVLLTVRGVRCEQLDSFAASVDGA